MTAQMDIGYALMAGAAYRTTRDPINWIPSPEGWTPFFPVPDPSTAAIFPVGSTGFEAISFKQGTEIVISYAGTYDKSTVDKLADVNLAQGVIHEQLLQAAKYFLDVRAANPGPPAPSITLTGHSLGGGLASLVAVFFGVSATTFDQAPFTQKSGTLRDGQYGRQRSAGKQCRKHVDRQRWQ